LVVGISSNWSTIAAWLRAFCFNTEANGFNTEANGFTAT
jgi:hypothetical protein